MQVETKTACIDRLIAALERLRLAEGRVLCPSDIDSEAPVDVSAHIQRHCVAFAVGFVWMFLAGGRREHTRIGTPQQPRRLVHRTI